ncbi:MAG: sugar MFS transporter [Kiritimatiellia bacterium]
MKPLLEMTFTARKRAGIVAMLIACFALWGLLNNMTDNLVPAFQRIFTMDQSKAGLIQVAFYGAYAVLAIFASILVEEFSYRVGVLIGLGVYVVGALLYIPACVAASFEVYFAAIFVVAAGCSLLETTCNPYVLALGTPETAVRRLNFAQAFNPLGSVLGVFLARGVILANLNPATAAERAAMDPAALRQVVDGELFWVCVPYVGLCTLAALIWVFFLRINPFASTVAEKRTGISRTLTAGVFALAPLALLACVFPQMDKVTWILLGMLGPIAYLLWVGDYRAMLFTLLRNPRYVGGVVAQFFYVGAQIAVWTWLNVYCQKELGVTPDAAAGYYLVSIFLFIACRWIATALMKFVPPALLLAVFAGTAIAACAGVMYGSGEVCCTFFGMGFAPNVLCLVALSGCMSLMFPTIYGIALEGLAPSAFRLGAAGLIMSILGGAIVTAWMGGVLGAKESAFFALVTGADAAFDVNLMTSDLALRASFAIPAICFAVVLVYALVFRRGRAGEERQCDKE